MGVTASAGNRVKIDTSLQANAIIAAGNPRLDYRIRIYRTATLLAEYRTEQNFLGGSGNQRYIESATFVDAPPAGSHTYQIRVAVITADSITSLSVETRALNTLLFA
ncbi:hypothetical protein D3P08_06760 [Paenibacillus nanensis]|uniref:Exosporium protein C n=1 Tax=Paenibacillus nanensis TaxID=393251 RepID=A0A3A1UZN6_9BACL|nr:hypothetical protein D3P08_06760 [Paenibacillus nanensis]